MTAKLSGLSRLSNLVLKVQRVLLMMVKSSLALTSHVFMLEIAKHITSAFHMTMLINFVHNYYWRDGLRVAVREGTAKMEVLRSAGRPFLKSVVH